jgi:hypothetical protein
MLSEVQMCRQNWYRRGLYGVGVLGIVLAACAADSEEGGDTVVAEGTVGGPTGAESTGGSPTTASSGSSGDLTNADEPGTETEGAVDSCADYLGVATPEEAAATPRGNLTGEHLGFYFTDAVVVPLDVYERTLTDFLVLSDLGFTGCNPYVPDPTKLSLTFEEPERSLVVDGSYDAWDCPNALYLGHVETLAGGEFVTLIFDGMFGPEHVAADYESLPGVVAAEAVPYDCHGDEGLPGPRRALHGCAQGDTWHWWWTDAYIGQPDFPITEGAHLVSEPGVPPAVICSWSDGEEPCVPPACLELPTG